MREVGDYGKECVHRAQTLGLRRMLEDYYKREEFGVYWRSRKVLLAFFKTDCGR